MIFRELLPELPTAAVALGQRLGARVIEPKLDASVIEAFWRNTRSTESMATTVGLPFDW